MALGVRRPVARYGLPHELPRLSGTQHLTSLELGHDGVVLVGAVGRTLRDGAHDTIGTHLDGRACQRSLDAEEPRERGDGANDRGGARLQRELSM